MRCKTRTGRIGLLALLLGVWVSVPLAVAPSEPPVPHLVAVGDVHGDYDGLLAILGCAGLATAEGRWKGGATSLVQVGDFLDRGTQITEVMDLLMSLEQQARADGGEATALLGNHEAMNLVGELRDVGPTLYAQFVDAESEARRQAAFEAHRALASRNRPLFRSPPPVYEKPDRDAWMLAHPPGYLEYRELLGPEGRYGRWLRERPAVVKVGRTIVVHGGIDPEQAPKRLEDINRQVWREIATFDRVVQTMVARGLALSSFTLQELFDAARAHVQRAREVTSGDDAAVSHGLAGSDVAQMEELLRIGSWHLLNPNGPLWFRGYATWKSSDEATGLSNMLARYDASRVVVGHTMLQSLRITPRFGGRVFLIDTGMLSSYYAGGRASALEVRGSLASAIYLDGSVDFAESGPGAEP